MDKLKDIRDIFEWSDYIPYMAIGFFYLLSFGFYYIKNLQVKKETIRKLNIAQLKSLDFTNSKKAAYKATGLLRAISQEDKEQHIADEIIKMLEKYKYIKNPPNMDDKIKANIDIL